MRTVGVLYPRCWSCVELIGEEVGFRASAVGVDERGHKALGEAAFEKQLKVVVLIAAADSVAARARAVPAVQLRILPQQPVAAGVFSGKKSLCCEVAVNCRVGGLERG